MVSLGQLLAKRSAVRIIGVHDGISAYMAEKSGAQALWASGLGIAASKAMPDNEVVTYETLMRRLDDIRRGSRLPLLADGNTGFGDQVIAHVVRMLGERGVDGIAFEDKAFPRRNSFDLSRRSLALEDPYVFADRLNRAATARWRGKPMVVARTEGLIANEPIEQVLMRAKLYTSAGADAIIVHSRSKSADEILSFAGMWDDSAALIVIPTTYPRLSFVVAAEAGIAGVICANQVMRAAVLATEACVAEIVKADSIDECNIPLLSLSRMLKIVDDFALDPSER